MHSIISTITDWLLPSTVGFPFQQALWTALCSTFAFQIALILCPFSHQKHLESKCLFPDTLMLHNPPFKLQPLSWAAHLSFFLATIIELSWITSFSDSCVDISALLSEEEAIDPDIGYLGVRIRCAHHGGHNESLHCSQPFRSGRVRSEGARHSASDKYGPRDV